jgi:YaiO family outer membrane protein
MRQLLLTALIAMAAAPVGAQVSSPDPPHATVVDLIAGRSTLRGGGSWRSADLVVTRTVPRTVGYLFLYRGTRPEGSGGFVGFAATHDWSRRFFTYAAAGASAPRASFLPRRRFDLELNWKLMPHQSLVAALGATSARYTEGRRDDVLSAGVTYYAPLITTYRYFRNTSTPGSVRSHAQLLQIAIERRGSVSAYLRHSWGNEAYLLTTIVSPQNVRLSGHSTTAFFRKWTTARGGVVGELEYQAKAHDFRRTGGRIGIFYSF